VKREFRYFLPVVEPVDVAAQSEAAHATVGETVSDDEKRIIRGESCSEVIAIRVRWRFTNSEIAAGIREFVRAYRPRNDKYKARQPKKGSRRDSSQSALDCLSAMRLASHFQKNPPGDAGASLAAFLSGDSIKFPPSAIALFNEIRLRGPPLQCNYAHCDFQFFENDEEVQKITKKSIKMQIRESLLPAIEREN